MAGNTTLCLLTRRSLASEAEAQSFFSIMAEIAPELLPEKYDVKEPIRELFDMARLDKPLAVWGKFPHHFFLWKRSKPRLSGQYFPASKRHAADSIQITFQGRRANEHTLIKLLRAWSERFPPIIAYIHTLHDEDLEDREFYGRHVMPFNQGLVLHDLKTGLPGLCWVTIFGPSYVELFGRDRLDSCPAYLAEQIAGGFYLQLTENNQTGGRNFEQFREARDRAIAHLDSHAFRGHSPVVLPELP